MTIAHWDEDPRLWQTLRIDDEDVPGVASVEATVGRKFDTKSAAGSDGGRVSDKGLELAEIKATVKFWTADHWTGIQSLIAKLGARRNLSDRNAVSVFHPELAALGIQRAIVKRVSSPRPASERGAREITIDLVEYNPPASGGSSRTRSPEMTFTDEESESSNQDRFAFDFGAEDP